MFLSLVLSSAIAIKQMQKGRKGVTFAVGWIWGNAFQGKLENI